MRAAMFLAALALATSHAAAQDLDPSFGDGGFALAARATAPGASSIPPGAIAPAPGGGYWWAMREGTQLALGRVTGAGAPDATFGGGSGRITLGDCVGNGTVDLLALPSGGVVLWTGRCLQRRDADGALDAAFGTNVGDLERSRLRRDPQGRYLLAGSAANAWHVYRFDALGHPDASFATNGHAESAIPSTNGFRGLTALAIRTDSSIVVAGWRGNTNGPSLALSGLDANGMPDPTFGVGGLVDVPHEGGDNTVRAHDAAALADGSVLVAGERGSGSVGCCVLVARFLRDGSLDPATGLRAFPLGNEVLRPFFEMRAAIAATADGGAWIARTSFPFQPLGHRTRFTLLRVTATGELDARFAARGWRSWYVAEPASHAPAGDYIQLHDTLFDADGVVFFGRTFFEDDGTGNEFVTFARVRFETPLRDGFD